MCKFISFKSLLRLCLDSLSSCLLKRVIFIICRGGMEMSNQILIFIGIVAVVAAIGVTLVVTHERNDNFENTRQFAR